MKGKTRAERETDAAPVPGAEMMRLSEEAFQAIRELVYSRFGINLTDQKRNLVVGRLQKVVRSLGMDSFEEYIAYVREEKTGGALEMLVNRISTNHTFFFREKAHFDFFSGHALPEAVARLRAQRSFDLRIWCAGCASGEEAYTLVMLMLQHFGADYRRWDAGLLATDISGRALEIARRAVYPDDRVAQVPEEFKRKYFSHIGPDQWQVKKIVRDEVTFRRLNFMRPSFPFKRPFQVIFCRNVMIYFDQPTRETLVRRLYDLTVPGGYLMIGHSESLRRETTGYEYVMPAVYRKPGGDPS